MFNVGIYIGVLVVDHLSNFARGNNIIINYFTKNIYLGVIQTSRLRKPGTQYSIFFFTSERNIRVSSGNVRLFREPAEHDYFISAVKHFYNIVRGSG